MSRIELECIKGAFPEPVNDPKRVTSCCFYSWGPFLESPGNLLGNLSGNFWVFLEASVIYDPDKFPGNLREVVTAHKVTGKSQMLQH